MVEEELLAIFGCQNKKTKTKTKKTKTKQNKTKQNKNKQTKLKNLTNSGSTIIKEWSNRSVHFVGNLAPVELDIKPICSDLIKRFLQVHPGGKDNLLVHERILDLLGEVGCLVFIASELLEACFAVETGCLLI